ncbi:DUF2341 domain-containing protein [Oceanicoccus sp. KOV_DT_Chl]|uniref:DUF2341 domain-containing protein n=1 Tax=Oceanicoccus sp. KOV_DT_Chl TaxID=1904639 RepID=UPI000C796B7D|nr:DUF2341 domain-containing protein [Oceanicoccus sp. KOV_DT_Chl]
MLLNKTWQRLLSTILLLWSVDALAWWNDAWPYRLPLGVDTSTATGAGISSNHQQMTVLVKLHSGNFQDFFLVNEDLSDIRFVGADDKTPLKHHVESVDFINQLAYIWVKLPDVQGAISTGKFWMYYGNNAAANNTDSGASYDKNTAAVFHFSEAAGMTHDASAYENHASSYSGVVGSAGVIAGDIALANGTNMLFSNSPSLAVSAEQGMTISLWMKSAGNQVESWLLHRADGGNELVVELNGNSISARLRLEDGQQVATPAVAAIKHGNWQFLSLTLNPDSMVLALDGEEVSRAAMTLQAFSGFMALGSSLDGEHGFTGNVDELRIDNIARSNEWLKLVLSSQKLNTPLLTYSAAEQLGAGGDSSNFFTVIFTSTDVSGWTVIVLLGAMALMSWIVMVGKVLMLSSVKKDNLSFMQGYRALGNNDPGMLDVQDSPDDKSLEDSPIIQAIFGEHDHFQSSPLYRVYHRGIQSVHSRIGRSVGAQSTGLSDGAISAIKAAINSQMVTELQRLNSQMVLLTIAISGGPFLGLFGTVLGVMITFAAIAATGDVNIAAIAPGVAAALLTTIVGLMVAIPAMFTYNWLQTRIKANVAEMRVFGEEFVTRIAEYYGNTK